MKKIELKKGYVQYPENWEELNPEYAKYSDHAGVITTNRENVPTFIFFCFGEVSDIDCPTHDELMKRCAMRNSDFQKILESLPIPIRGNENEILNVDEMKNSAHIGIFPADYTGEAKIVIGGEGDS